MPRKRKKKPRRHFKFNLERIAKHIGKIADNSSVKDVQEVVLNAVLAYASLTHLRRINPDGSVVYDPLNALFGPISLKLAQTDGLVSQTAGVAGLCILGVAMIGGEAVKQVLDESQWAYIRKRNEPWEIDGKKVAMGIP